ncbi:hypothetical protein GFY24_38830 [Nocardia sp. SYP-A9097]|uniref:hypothetical protein n=1 Tax=Nocardia sp. SYP-A9097 TaxID=2663237 RepID=UPI00129BB8DE|nr:hypothetical protein [Nocardia sp. SYP-A9097]MRH93305.1 hypothetical protein [Nocardia sp. SYP-A9097]
MANTYEASILDAVGLRRFAQEVSSRISGSVPTLDIPSSRSPDGAIRVWELGSLVEEGAKTISHIGAETLFGSWEAGYVYFLSADGKLLAAPYRVSNNKFIPDDPVTGTHEPLTPLGDEQLTALDWRNDGDYERISPDREEYEYNRKICVAAKGDGLRRALSDLLDPIRGEQERDKHRQRVAAAQRQQQARRRAPYISALKAAGRRVLYAAALWGFTALWIYQLFDYHVQGVPRGSYQSTAASLIVGIFLLYLVDVRYGVRNSAWLLPGFAFGVYWFLKKDHWDVFNAETGTNAQRLKMHLDYSVASWWVAPALSVLVYFVLAVIGSRRN